MPLDPRESRFIATNSSGEVSAIYQPAAEPRALFVFAHGAGAGMRHTFMERFAGRCADAGVSTFRYQFPYMEAERRRPDHAPILRATVRSAIAAAGECAPDAAALPWIVGGKSMGGRMTSLADADQPLTRPDGAPIDGIAFVGFPLHPAGKPGRDRADHLAETHPPLLFLQGTRDRLAELEFLRPEVAKLGGRARLEVFDGADHSFDVLKRSGIDPDELHDRLVGALAEWSEGLVPPALP